MKASPNNVRSVNVPGGREDNNGLAGRMREETNFPVCNTPYRKGADFERRGDIPTATSSPASKALFFKNPFVSEFATIFYLHVDRLSVRIFCWLI
jgi:hypothetical protein